MVNLALTLAFTLSAFISPGGRILGLVFDRAVFSSLPPYQGHLLLAFANYWIPTVLIYLLLRFLPAARRLRPTAGIHWLFGTGNFLLLFYVAVRIFASTIQGGGASFAVMSLAPYVIRPARLLQLIGGGWLLVRTLRGIDSPAPPLFRPFGPVATLVVGLALTIPVAAGASILYLGKNAPMRLAGEAKSLFRELCQGAGETIVATPENVESLYLEPDGGEYFDKIRGGVYYGHGNGILGGPLLHKGWLSVVETPDTFKRDDVGERHFRRYTRDDRRGIPVTQLNSQYGVFSRSLVDADVRRRLKVWGNEVTIQNLESGEVTATLIYFVSDRQRAVCGQAGDGSFSVSDFIKRALDLTQKDYPGSESQ